MHILNGTVFFPRVYSRVSFPRYYSTTKLKRTIKSQASETSVVEWMISNEVNDRKSVFIGRACSVTSVEEAERNLSLLKTEKRIAKASHNITAWRIRGPNNSLIQEFDDNGEAPGGERILKLLTLVDISNVMVVVTRWYGGVQLGNDRFKHINTCAQEALMNGGFMTKKGKDKRKKR